MSGTTDAGGSDPGDASTRGSPLDAGSEDVDEASTRSSSSTGAPPDSTAVDTADVTEDSVGSAITNDSTTNSGGSTSNSGGSTSNSGGSTSNSNAATANPDGSTANPDGSTESVDDSTTGDEAWLLPDCAGTLFVEEFDQRDLDPRWNAWRDEDSGSATYELADSSFSFHVAAGATRDTGIETRTGDEVNIAMGFALVEFDGLDGTPPELRFYFKLSRPEDACEDVLWIQDERATWRDSTRTFAQDTRLLRWRGDSNGLLHIEGSSDGSTWTDVMNPQAPNCDITAVKVHVYTGAIVDAPLSADATIALSSMIACLADG